jgi:hypothetical protein
LTYRLYLEDARTLAASRPRFRTGRSATSCNRDHHTFRVLDVVSSEAFASDFQGFLVVTSVELAEA